MALMRNLSWLALGEGVGRLVALGIVLYLARVVGAPDFGLLGSAVALVTWFAIFVAGGVDYKGVREIARNPADVATVLRVNIAAHLVCLAVVYAGARARASRSRRSRRRAPPRWCWSARWP